MRGADQRAVEAIGPAVVPALYSPGKPSFALGTDAGSAMPAHVEKRPHRAGLVTGENDAFARHLTREIISGGGNLVGASGADPRLAIESLDFVAEKNRVRVVAGRKRLSGELEVGC